MERISCKKQLIRCYHDIIETFWGIVPDDIQGSAQYNISIIITFALFNFVCVCGGGGGGGKWGEA